MEKLVIKCGKNSDSLEKLKELCKAEAEKLLPTIEVENGSISVSCWTDGAGIAELIGVVYFRKDANGKIYYEFEDSESTL